MSAVWCAFYLGNFGSRSRRGFGSIVVYDNDLKKIISDNNFISFKPQGNISDCLKQNLEKIKKLNHWKRIEYIPYIFEDLEVYKSFQNWFEDIKKDRKDKNGNLGKFFHKGWALSGLKTLNDLLDFMGFILMAYMSYYKPNYDVAKEIISRGNQGKYQNQKPEIEKVSFGLPLNFYFSSLNRRRGMVMPKLGNKNLRRASPLIFKIISDGNNFEGFFIRFKEGSWKFLPDRAVLELNRVRLNMPSPKTEVINEFISSLESHNLIRRRIYP